MGIAHGDPVLQLSNVSMSIGRSHILESISLSFFRGGLTAIMGPSGCGKTSLLRTIAGILSPSLGHIEMHGAQYKGPSQTIGYVPQSYPLFDWCTVVENIDFGRVKKPKAAFSAHYLLERVGMEPYAKAFPRDLSGGMRQRVAIARALAVEPQMLLLDEPFSALDIATRESIQALLSDIRREYSIDMILVTHDIDEALILADEIVLMDGKPGRVVDQVSVDFGASRKSDLRYTAEFLKMHRWISEHFFKSTVIK